MSQYYLISEDTIEEIKSKILVLNHAAQIMKTNGHNHEYEVETMLRWNPQ